MAELGVTGDSGRGVRRRAAAFAAGRLVLGLAAAALLAACESDRQAYAPEPTLTVEQRYPITLAENREVLEVPVSPGAPRLTAAQRAEIAGFLRAYRDGGSGPLVVRAPSGTRNEVAALAAIDEIRELVAASSITSVSYSVYRAQSSRSVHPPVLLAYTGVRAVSPECGNWSENIAANYGNTRYPNFGCASQRNLAAMVDNSRDLAVPRGMDPASSERRQTVRDKYIAGEATAAKVDDDDKGTASKVGQ